MSVLFLVLAVIVLAVAFVVFRGAPYLPTRGQDIESLLNSLKLSQHDVFVDLGAGDGSLVRAVANSGVEAYGYELSPVVFIFAWLGCLRYRPKAHVRLADLWRVKLPADTTVVYTFLHTRFMKKFDRKMQEEAGRLGHSLRVISYAFEIPGRKYEKKQGALYFYVYSPL